MWRCVSRSLQVPYSKRSVSNDSLSYHISRFFSIDTDAINTASLIAQTLSGEFVDRQRKLLTSCGARVSNKSTIKIVLRLSDNIARKIHCPLGTTLLLNEVVAVVKSPLEKHLKPLLIQQERWWNGVMLLHYSGRSDSLGSYLYNAWCFVVTAQSAATLNARTTREEDKTKLGDILSNATAKLPSDKGATRRDADRVMDSEMRNDPNLTTHPAGLATSLATAARLNKSHK